MDDRSLSLHPFSHSASGDPPTAAMAPLNPLSLAPNQQQHPFLAGTSSMHHQARSEPHHQHPPQPSHPNHHHHNHSSTTTTTTTGTTQEDPPTDQEIAGGGGPTATAPFLRDFSLVAEAAKRAQMSIMMRDLESVTL